MDDTIRRALDHGHTIDITTTGRRTGLPRRVEIAFHNLDHRLYISGLPSRRTRAWIHNLEADPRLTFHLKDRQARADLDATARVVTDVAERSAVIPRIAAIWGRTDAATMIELSPLIEVTIPGYSSDGGAGPASPAERPQ